MTTLPLCFPKRAAEALLPPLLKLFSSYLRAYPDYSEIRFLLPDGYEDARATLLSIPNATENEGDTGHTLIVNETGKILFHQDTSQVGRHISMPILNKALAVGESKQLVSATYQESRSLLSARRLHKDLLLIGMLPEVELLKESQRLGKACAWIVLGAVTLMIVVLLIAMSFLMVRPLQHLMMAVREIGRGNPMPTIA